jgi:hypothetical protein
MYMRNAMHLRSGLLRRMNYWLQHIAAIEA